MPNGKKEEEEEGEWNNLRDNHQDCQVTVSNGHTIIYNIFDASTNDSSGSCFPAATVTMFELSLTMT